ncbi:hypothetical protein DFJ73DRAFT_811741 [Zopfochytrium polystomum]|nr:hypothetical protein DFJ73DRAFT_811741 [Zopfochytrium polystomum]
MNPDDVTTTTSTSSSNKEQHSANAAAAAAGGDQRRQSLQLHSRPSSAEPTGPAPLPSSSSIETHVASKSVSSTENREVAPLVDGSGSSATAASSSNSSTAGKPSTTGATAPNHSIITASPGAGQPAAPTVIITNENSFGVMPPTPNVFGQLGAALPGARTDFGSFSNPTAGPQPRPPPDIVMGEPGKSVRTTADGTVKVRRPVGRPPKYPPNQDPKTMKRLMRQQNQQSPQASRVAEPQNQEPPPRPISRTRVDKVVPATVSLDPRNKVGRPGGTRHKTVHSGGLSDTYGERHAHLPAAGTFEFNRPVLPSDAGASKPPTSSQFAAMSATREKDSLSIASGSDRPADTPVVLQQSPHPWRWAPGLRAGELGWAEIPLSKEGRPVLCRPTGATNLSLSSSYIPVKTALWPVQIVDRWVSRRHEEDPRSVALRAISEEGLLPFKVNGTGKFDLLNTIAASKVGKASSTSLTATEDASPANFPLASGNAMDVDEPTSVETGDLVSGKSGVSAVEAFEEDENEGIKKDVPEDAVEMGEGAADDSGKAEGTKSAPLVNRRSVGRPKYLLKSLLQQNTSLDDPTGIFRTRTYFIRKCDDSPLETDSDSLDEDEEETLLRDLLEPSDGASEKSAEKIEKDTEKKVESGSAKNSGALQVHYIVRPLPIRDLSLSSLTVNTIGSPIRRFGVDYGEASEDGPQGGDDEMDDCFYCNGASVVPFSLFNPDCRDDICWNVAALQALDIATTWAVPPREEDYPDPEEIGVWAEVLESMQVPSRPDQVIGEVLQSSDISDLAVLKKRRRTVRSETMALPVALTESDIEDGVDNYVQKTRKIRLRPETERRVWGLVKKYGSEAQKLIKMVRSLSSWRWTGDDAFELPDLLNDERLVQRLRLGPDRIQIGDLVRLSTTGGLNPWKPGTSTVKLGAKSKSEKSIPSTVSAVVLPRVCIETLAAEAARRRGHIALRPNTLANFVQNEPSLRSDRTSENGPSRHSHFGTHRLDPTNHSSSNEADDPFAAGYALCIPAIDPVDYLEVAHIILRRPRVPASNSSLDSAQKYHINDTSTHRASVRLVGRVYKRVPASREDWMKGKTLAGSGDQLSVDGTSPVSLWMPTGEMRTVDVSAGEVVCRAHSQFVSRPINFAFGAMASASAGGVVAGAVANAHHHELSRGILSTAGAPAAWNQTIVVGGVGPAWRGGGVVEGLWEGNRQFTRETTEVSGYLRARLAADGSLADSSFGSRVYRPPGGLDALKLSIAAKRALESGS